LARALSKAGHRVIAAESMDYPLSIHSSAFTRFYPVTAPNLSLEHFKNDLMKIIDLEKVDLLVPTCEEAFHIAKIRDVLMTKTKVLVDSHEKLAELHSKFKFNDWVRSMGMAAPRSERVSSKEEMKAAIDRMPGKSVVLKPEFSRFASKTFVLSKNEAIKRIDEIYTPVNWVVQECLIGQEYCSYSFAVDGKLIAHVTYDHEFTAGKGAGICFESIHHPVIESWVRNFVAEIGYTGQIAFDFIEDEFGVVRPLECNPRATSGLHLIAQETEFVNALARAAESVDQTALVIRPKRGTLGQLRLAMLVYGLPSATSVSRLWKWLKIFATAREVVFSLRDPFPFFDQFVSFYRLIRESRQLKITPLEVSTRDIEWNGEA
jgi:predicted ATP-grasp superfamily ATP-dependent carboligase